MLLSAAWDSQLYYWGYNFKANSPVFTMENANERKSINIL
jgi:hypothetical protein